ncbi:MAG TPA: hypothetical protein VM680_08665 [Verrucomicrobiae bacterium]|nr:hypothetical protein [Verrucomicrobiae bacterium]
MAARAAAAIKKELGVDAETIVGESGEFSVLVNGQKVIGKGILLLPSEKKVVAAVRKGIGGS